MDLSSINLEQSADKGAFLHLEHPVTGEKLYTEDEKPIGFDVVGTDSSRYRRKISELANRKMGKRQKHVTLEKAEQEGAELLSACIIKCHNVTIDGEQIKPESVEHVLLKHRWIHEQVDDFVGDRRNFFPIA